MKNAKLKVQASSTTLIERNSYDVALVRIQAVDEFDNILYFCGEPLEMTAEGPIEVIGPNIISLKGGQAGVYVKSTGESGTALLEINNQQLGEKEIRFEVQVERVV